MVKGQEHAKGSKKGDLKEFFHIGSPSISNPQNIWPHEIENFNEIGSEVFITLENIGLSLLRAISMYLNLNMNYFEEKVKGGESILRSIHYFPLDPQIYQMGSKSCRTWRYKFNNSLMGASADGLEILTKQNKWIPISSKEDELVINVGDMLERLTNKRLLSTVHRVVNPSIDKLGTSRYSIPFFMHPKPEMDLSCLESCYSQNNPKQFEDITAGRFLEERLRDIGLKS